MKAGLRLVAAAAIVAGVAAADVVDAGSASALENGDATRPGDYSFYVDLGGCGGALIAADWVITAKHCANGLSLKPGSTVGVGWNSSSSTIGTIKTTVRQVVLAPIIAAHDGIPQQDWDIALLKVDPVSGIRPLPLAARATQVGDTLRNVAAGTGSNGLLTTAEFRVTTFKGWGSGAIDQPYTDLRAVNPDTWTDFGDSGSPFIADTSAGPEFVGVVSRCSCEHGGATSIDDVASTDEMRSWVVSTTGVPARAADVTASATSTGAGSASDAVDGNVNTIWQSTDSVASLTIDRTAAGADVPVNTLTYQPRNDGNTTGRITHYAIAVSQDGHFYTEVTRGYWSADSGLKTATWGAVPGARYVALEGLTGEQGVISAAEVSIHFSHTTTGPNGVTAVEASTAQSGMAPERATDGDPNTIWHSYWDTQQMPQWITVQVNQSATALTYLPRQDGSSNGIVTAYEVQGSYDGISFTPIASGTWPQNTDQKTTSTFSGGYPFLRLVATAGSGNFGSAAEIGASQG